MRTRIRLLPLSDSVLVVTKDPLGEWSVGTIALANSPITVEIGHDDVVVRQEDDGFGGLADVFTISQVRTVNNSGKSWHLVIRTGPTAAYEDQIHDGQEKIVDLAPNERFESSQLGMNISYIRD